MKVFGFDITVGPVRPMARVEVVVHRGGRMTDAELMLKLNVMDDHHVLAGVGEVLDRLEDEADEMLCNPERAAQADVNLAAMKFTLREVRKHIAINVQAARRKAVESR